MAETLKGNGYREIKECCATCRDGIYGVWISLKPEDVNGVAPQEPEMWCERIGATDDSDDIKPNGHCREWKAKGE